MKPEIKPQKKVVTKLPSFAEATAWLNRTAADLQETSSLGTKGHPTLVHFWSITSEDSKTNLAQMAQLRDQRRRDGLRVIAIHSPQSEAEKDLRAIGDALARFNLTEPCALDNDHQLRDAFAKAREDLPAYYLFDVDANLVRSAIGANGLDAIEDQLDEMLAKLRAERPFCPSCELFLNKEAMFCAECGVPLNLPGPGKAHPYYETHYQGSLPTVRLFDLDPLVGHLIDGKYELVAKLGEGADECGKILLFGQATDC